MQQPNSANARGRARQHGGGYNIDGAGPREKNVAVSFSLAPRHRHRGQTITIDSRKTAEVNEGRDASWFLDCRLRFSVNARVTGDRQS